MHKSMHDFFKNLKHIELEFPNKEQIYIEDAVLFIQNILKTDVEEGLIIHYLKQKGYKKIEKKQKNLKPLVRSNDNDNFDDDFDLDNFLSENNEPEVPEQTLRRKKNGLFESNIELIHNYHSYKNESLYAEIVEQNLRLVHKEASKLQNWMVHKLSYDDLVQEGVFGLMKAIERFDPSLGNQFSTYATWWIRQKILRAICDIGNTVRIPVHMIEQVNKVRKVERQSMLNENEINKRFVCETLNISKEKYEQLKLIESRYFKITSLNGIVSEEDGDTELLNFISNDHVVLLGIEMSDYQDPYLMIEEKDVSNRIFIALSELKEKERNIIIERYGLNDGKDKTLEEVGKLYGVTRERIRQIEKKAMNHLRLYLENNGVDTI